MPETAIKPASPNQFFREDEIISTAPITVASISAVVALNVLVGGLSVLDLLP